MKQSLSLILCLFLSFSVYSQQLPDPHFEDWSGTAFDGNAQPKYWHGDNIEQSGFKFTMLTKGTGRSGSCLAIQDVECKAFGIGQTSPGYAGLGNSWQYISGIDLSSASGGFDGGISMKYRPDSMAVWIKRTGNNTGDENYNILYYSWSGTFKSSRYKAQSGDCASTSHTDEESDVRQALDANSCGTDSKGTQVAEGWKYEKRSYGSWTRIVIPIYYFSDLVPDKCNVIFSAGNYPNFRETTGMYAGNSLYVDDVELIYSSKIQRLYVGGKEWKGFDPNQTEQTYPLSRDITQTPTIEAVRGVGSLTNVAGKTVQISGRKLQGNEISIKAGAIDGAATEITVKAEDGSSTTMYKIRFVHEASTNAKLNAILVNGEPIANFKSGMYSYDVALPYGSTQAPVVSVEKQEDEQQVRITQPTSITGTSTIEVTAADGKTKCTYQLRFSVAPLSDNTLQDILVNGKSVTGFTPGQTIYKVSLPTTTTIMPTVKAVSAYPDGAQTIKYTAPDKIDGGQYQIAVTTPGNPTAKTYKLTFRLEASDYVYLKNIQIGGKDLDGFRPEVMNYSIQLPIGTSTLPAITWTKGEDGQTVTKTEGGIDGTTKLLVTAANGNQTTYKLTFSTQKSEISTLNGILIGGVALSDFAPTKTQYAYELPIGTTTLPEITVVKGDPYQKVTITTGGVNGTTRIVVTAGNGNTTVYQIVFSVAQATNNTLKMIYLDGNPLKGFQAETEEYSVALPKGTTTLPVITYDAHDEYQTITTRSGGVNGDYKITVRPGSGASRTYVIHFSVVTSDNTQLKMIYLDGEAISSFHPDTLFYTDTLPAGESRIPTVTYDKSEESQRVLSVIEEYTQTLTVSAESGSKRVYTISFIVQKSANAYLKNIYLDGKGLSAFDSATLNYRVELADTALCPFITVDKYPGQQITILRPYNIGNAEIIVQPEQGAKNTYLIEFYNKQQGGGDIPEPPYEPSTNSQLAGISVNTTPLTDFRPDQTTYAVVLPAGSTTPQIGYVKGDAKQHVLAGLTDVDQYRAIVRAENGDTTVYTIRFSIAPYSDVRLESIRLEGIAFVFDPDTYTYDLALDEGAKMPELSYTMRAGQKSAYTQVSDTTQQIIVVAENKAQAVYTLNYHRQVSKNALLKTILVGNDTLPLFAPETFAYVDTLPWRSKIIPNVMPIGQLTSQTITTYMSSVNQSTRIEVVAQDGKTKQTYTVAFPVRKSSNTRLKDLYINSEQVSITFDPDTLHYTVNMPYQSTEIPTVVYEKSEWEQSVQIQAGSLGDTTRLLVKAENGETREYSIAFHRTLSDKENRLKSLQIAETQEILNPDTTNHQITLPYGTRSLTVNYTKMFAEQTIIVEPGGVTSPTRIRVKANRANEQDVVYTLTPNLVTTNPAVFTNLLVNGQKVKDFQSDRLSYVVEVNTVPIISYELPDGAKVVVNVQNDKHWQATVSAQGYSQTYQLWYYYPHDIIPNADFTEWTTAKYNSADKPTGWAVVADASEKYLGNTTGSECKKDGASVAKLSSVYKGYCCRSTPGVITLGSITGTLNTTNSFTVSGSIAFKNSPDILSVRYKATKIYNKNRIVYQLWGSNGYYAEEHNDTEEFSDYRTLDIDLTKANQQAGYPTAMNILLNSYYAEQGGLGSEGMGTTSEMYVDYLQLKYNSILSGLTVNGLAAQLSGNDFTITLPGSEDNKIPALAFSGAVTDQAQKVVWNHEQVKGNYAERSATITNYAENGSSTQYTLVVKRPLSTIDTLGAIMIGGEALSTYEGLKTEYTINLPQTCYAIRDIYPIPASTMQQVSAIWEDSTYVVTVKSEKGSLRTYRIRFVTPPMPKIQVNESEISGPDVPPATTSGLLSELELDGNIPADFQPTVFQYTKSRPTITAYVCQDYVDSVVYIQSPVDMQWQVYGSQNHTYIVTYPTQKSSSTLITAITNNGKLLTGFDAHIYDYIITTDSMVQLQIEGQQGQSLKMDYDTAFNRYTIQVKAEDGTQGTPYTVTIQKPISSLAELQQIWIDSIALMNFHPDSLRYQIYVPSASPKKRLPIMPSIQYSVAHRGTRVEQILGSLGETTYLGVTSPDGLQSRQYELFFVAEPSHVAELTQIKVDGVALERFSKDRYYYSATTTRLTPSIEWKYEDNYQRVEHLINGNIHTLRVTAEDSVVVREYEIELFYQQPSNDATLQMILLNGTTMEQFDTIRNPQLAFDPMQNVYQIHLPSGSTTLPDISTQLGMSGQQVSMERIGMEVYIRVVAPDSVTINQYSLLFDMPQSGISTLKMIYVDGEELIHFNKNNFFYQIALPIGAWQLPEVVGQKEEAVQVLHPVVVDEKANKVTLSVTSEDGRSTSTYTLLFTYTLSAVDTLGAILEDGQALTSYRSDTYFYSRTLPTGTRIYPIVEWEEGDEWQSIRLDTLSTDVYTQVLQIVVKAQNGQQKTYTLSYEINKSENDTLQMISLDSKPIELFSGMRSEYTCVLASDTMPLPKISWERGDAYQRDSMWYVADSITAYSVGTKARIQVWAENGNTRIYTIYFTRALDANANLKMIYVGGKELENFDAEILQYRVSLAKGESQPQVTYALNEHQTAILTSSNDTISIDVKAENGTQQTYRVYFLHLLSNNSLLNGILLDSIALPDFQPSTFEYHISLPFGTMVLPHIGVELQDSAQTYVISEPTNMLSGDRSVTITVTAEDEESQSEYMLVFHIEKNDDNTLSMIWVKGDSLAAFVKDTTEYHLIYDKGTSVEEFAKVKDIRYNKSDSLATDTIYEDATHTIYIVVTAANGEARTYSITQATALSNNIRLSSLLINGKEVNDFDSNIMEYTYYTSDGQPEVLAVVEDSTTQVDYSRYMPDEDFYVYLTAEDGTEGTYTIHFRSTTISSTQKPGVKDVLVKHINGTNEWVFATLRKNVSVVIYDQQGKVVFTAKVPESDQNDAIIYQSEDMQEELIDVRTPLLTYTLPVQHQVYIYSFWENSKTLILSGKIAQR